MVESVEVRSGSSLTPLASYPECMVSGSACLSQSNGLIRIEFRLNQLMFEYVPPPLFVLLIPTRACFKCAPPWILGFS